MIKILDISGHIQSILLDEQAGVHEPRGRHLANAFPFVAYYVILLHCVQRNEVESSEDEDLLGFEDGDCGVCASCLLHWRHVFPFPISFLEFLDGAHVIVAVEATDCVNAVSQHSRCQCSSRLIHIGKQLPFLYFGVVDFHRFQRLVIAASESADRVYSVILANHNSEFVSWFDHRLDALPFTIVDVEGFNSVEDAFAIVSADEV